MKKKKEPSRRNGRIETFRRYCTGCGACSAEGVRFAPDEKEFSAPCLEPGNLSLCRDICPAGGRAFSLQQADEWGARLRHYAGWSTDEAIRHTASSGGVLTALCIFLLETGRADAVIQTRRSADDPTRAVTVVSTTRADVVACAGSRYTASSPLMDVAGLIEEGKTYAFVGKPCDVSALSLLQKREGPARARLSQIRYLFSFFCAGQPSRAANQRLLEALGCASPADCRSLTYRGNGWPGRAVAVRADGQEKAMDYQDSWGRILGRDVRLFCRLCADGVGEFADISCGDAWYLDSSREAPDLSEHPGRNVVFARTRLGLELIEEAARQGCIELGSYNLDELALVQKFQFERKRNLLPQIIALRMAGRPVPAYALGKLRAFNSRQDLKKTFRRFAGTISRVARGKL